MTRARHGKIARLPSGTRDEISRRLEEGQPAKRILNWLNRQRDVKAIMAIWFSGCRVNEQNLTNWRAGGHQDWLRQQERRYQILDLVENAHEFAVKTKGVEPANLLSTVLVAELAVAARDAQAELTDPVARCKQLQELLGALAKVRQQDYLAGRLAIDREHRARERAEEKSLDEYRREVAPFVAQIQAASDARMFRAHGIRPTSPPAKPWSQRSKAAGDGAGSRAPLDSRPAPVSAGRVPASAAGVGCGKGHGLVSARPAPQPVVPRRNDGRCTPVGAVRNPPFRVESRSIKVNQGQAVKAETEIRRPKIEIRKKSEDRNPNQPAESNVIRRGDGPEQMHLKHTGGTPVPPGAESGLIRQEDRQAEARRIFMPGMASFKTDLEEIKPMESEIRSPKGEIREKSEGRNPNQAAGSNLIREGEGGEMALRHAGQNLGAETPLKHTGPNLGLAQTPVPLEEHEPNFHPTDLKHTGKMPVPLLPEQEAYNCWFQMNRGAEPFDQEKLDKLYAAIPAKKI
jgi:hypothetical protein